MIAMGINTYRIGITPYPYNQERKRSVSKQNMWSLEAMFVPLAVVASVGIMLWDFFTREIGIKTHDGQYVTTTRSQIIRDTQRSLEELM